MGARVPETLSNRDSGRFWAAVCGTFSVAILWPVVVIILKGTWFNKPYCPSCGSHFQAWVIWTLLAAFVAGGLVDAFFSKESTSERVRISGARRGSGPNCIRGCWCCRLLPYGASGNLLWFLLWICRIDAIPTCVRMEARKRMSQLSAIVTQPSPGDFDSDARRVARNPTSSPSLRLPIIAGSRIPTSLESALLSATASYDPIANVDIITNGLSGGELAKFNDALDRISTWGWSNVFQGINTIEVVTGCKENLLLALPGSPPGFAPWFETDPIIDQFSLGSKCILTTAWWWNAIWLVSTIPQVPISFASFGYHWARTTPKASKEILLRTGFVTDPTVQVQDIAWLILHEALHHKFYAAFSTCLNCVQDHRGIGMAWAVNAATIGTLNLASSAPWPNDGDNGNTQPGQYSGIEEDPADSYDLMPKISGMPSSIQGRLDTFSAAFSGWGTARWLDFFCPYAHFTYSTTSGPQPSDYSILSASETNETWATKFIVTAMEYTVAQWAALGKISGSPSAKMDAVHRGYAALMAKIGMSDIVYRPPQTGPVPVRLPPPT